MDFFSIFVLVEDFYKFKKPKITYVLYRLLK